MTYSTFIKENLGAKSQFFFCLKKMKQAFLFLLIQRGLDPIVCPNDKRRAPPLSLTTNICPLSVLVPITRLFPPSLPPSVPPPSPPPPPLVRARQADHLATNTTATGRSPSNVRPSCNMAPMTQTHGKEGRWGCGCQKKWIYGVKGDSARRNWCRPDEEYTSMKSG